MIQRGGCNGHAKAQARGATPRPRSGAEAGRTPCPKGGGQEELPHVGGQGQRPRVPDCDGARTAKRSYPASEVGGGGREEWVIGIYLTNTNSIQGASHCSRHLGCLWYKTDQDICSYMLTS